MLEGMTKETTRTKGVSKKYLSDMSEELWTWRMGRQTFVSNTKRSSLDLFDASDALPPLLIECVFEFEG